MIANDNRFFNNEITSLDETDVARDGTVVTGSDQRGGREYWLLN